jgi:dynein heavy chain
MGDVEKQMITAVRNEFEIGINDYVTQERNDWIVTHAGQIVLDTSKCHWTLDVEKALDEEGEVGIKKYSQFLQDQLNSSVMLVRQKLSKLNKISVNALIVIDVHALEVVKLMADARCSNKADFEWVQQLRYYWCPDEAETLNCFVRCVATDYPYGYEYLGNTGRLVITELTDKCYMTLMGAL